MAYETNGTLRTNRISPTDETISIDDWSTVDLENLEKANGIIRLPQVVPSSVDYQYVSESFASPWPDEIDDPYAEITVNGLSSSTFDNGAMSVYGDGTAHGEASGPESLPTNETFGVAFTAEWSNIDPGGGAMYFAGSRDGSSDFFIRNDQDGPDGNIGLKLDDGTNDLRVYTDSAYDDGSVQPIIINKSGNAGSDIDIYVGDMSTPVSVTVDTDNGFSHSSYSNSAGLGFWDVLIDGAPNDNNLPAHIGIFEFNTEPYTQTQRKGFASRRPEVDFNDPGTSAIPGQDGAWTWFADPRAVHYNGVTYVGYIGTDGDIYAYSYDHDTEEETNTQVYSIGSLDDHCSTALFIRNDGRIGVVFVDDGGSNRQGYWTISDNAEDVSSFGSVSSFPDDVQNYVNPRTLSGSTHDHHLVYFARDPSNRWVSYRTSDDDGSSWSSPTQIINWGGERCYFKAGSDGDSQIHIGCTPHPDDSQPFPKSVYYAYLEDGSLYGADGTELVDSGNLPADETNLEVVYDASVSGNPKAWIWDSAVDENGNPHLTFATVPDSSNHTYYYARWTGSAWEVHEVASGGGTIDEDGTQPSYSGGIVLNHNDPTEVYISRQLEGDVRSIENGKTTDGGETWSWTELTQDPNEKNIRPVSVRNAHADLNVVWPSGRYDHYTDFDMTLMSDYTDS